MEVFVALLLLALGLLLLPMLKMTTLLATNTSNPSRTLVALDMAQDAIDRFEQMPWDALRSSSAEGFDEERDIVEPVFSRLPQAAGDSTTVDGVEYHRLWRVVTDPEVPRLKTVTVWCCWRPDGTRWRHVTLLTQIADRAR